MRWLFTLVAVVHLTYGTTLAQVHQIRIIHTNDIGGVLVDAVKPGTALAAKITAVERLKKDWPHMVVDVGNAFGPDNLSAWEEGRSVAEAFKRAGYSGFTPGHHDFDYGIDALTERSKQAGLPFLVSNITASRPQDRLPFEPYVITQVGGVTIGLIGAVDGDIGARMNPETASKVVVTDPVKSAQAMLSALENYGVDLTILLLHADVKTSLTVARALPGLDLLIAGGHVAGQTENATIQYKLANGVQVLTTPPGGVSVGYADLVFRQESGGFELDAITTGAIETSQLQQDSSVVARADSAQLAYAANSGDLLGKIEGISVERRAGAVANLMRLHTESEIGVVSHRTFQEVEVSVGFYQRDVSRLIRFDDVLVKVTLTGRQLRGIVKRSNAQKGGEDALIFAGLNTMNLVVNGRSIRNREAYRVVTLRRLTQGESGYKEMSEGLSVQNTGISLRSLTVAGIKAWGTLSSASFWELNLKPIWRSSWSVAGSFNRNYIDRTTVSYRSQGERVSFLRGETSFAWKATSRYLLGYESSRSATTFESRADFGRVAGETTSDQFDVDVTHGRRVHNLKADPFVSTGFGTAFTQSGEGRPYQARASAGFERRFLSKWVAQFAAKGQRDFGEDQSDYGAEITLDYEVRLRQGGRFRSKVESFFGFSDRKVISVENYNTLNFPLLGELSLSIRQNNFMYRLDKIRGVPVSGIAFRSDLTIGLTYGIDWKWL